MIPLLIKLSYIPTNTPTNPYFKNVPSRFPELDGKTKFN